MRNRISRLGLVGAASVLALGVGLPAGAAPVVHGIGASWLGDAVIKVVGVSAGGSVSAGGAGVSAGADVGTDGSAGAGADTGTGSGDTSGSGDTGGTGGTGTGGTGTDGTGTGSTGTGDTGTGGTGTGDTGTGGTGTGGTGTGDTGSGGTDTGGTDTGGDSGGSPSGGAAGPSVAPSHGAITRSDVPQNSPLGDRPAAIVDIPPATTLQPTLIPSDNCISGAAPCPMGSGQVGGLSQPLGQGASGAGNGAGGLSASTTASTAPQPAARTSEGLGISLVDPVRSDNGLLVQGVIVNLSGQDRAIPPMRVELLNSANQVVQRSLVTAPVGTLAGGAHKTFKTLVQPLPPNIARVSVAFIPQQ